MIFVHGAYQTDGADPPVFRHVATSDTAGLRALVQQLAERVDLMLEKRGLIERKAERTGTNTAAICVGNSNLRRMESN